MTYLATLQLHTKSETAWAAPHQALLSHTINVRPVGGFPDQAFSGSDPNPTISELDVMISKISTGKSEIAAAVH